MDVIDTWTGQTACTLQAALRMTNERFARHLGIAVRTVAAWHQDATIVPRTEMQENLDTAYERASATAQRRFALLSRPQKSSTEVQALRVAIAVVLRGDDVLLVCRRDGGDISWQFPAGIVKPGGAAEKTAVQETVAETGVHCSVRHHLGSRLHPISGTICDYFACEYLTGDASNRDTQENLDVQWVPRAALTKFIPTDRIYPPILAALKEPA